MKKFFFVAAIALVSLFCISANAESTETAPVERIPMETQILNSHIRDILL